MSLILPAIGAFGHTAAGGGSLTYVTSGSALADNVSVPSHTSGDIIIAGGFRHTAGSAPSTPSGYTDIATAIGDNMRTSAFYKASDGSTHTLTITNAEGVAFSIYRPSGGTAAIGGSATDNNSVNPINIPAVTMDVGDGSSWIVALWAAKDGGVFTPGWTGLTSRQVQTFTAMREMGIDDTNAGVSSWAQVGLNGQDTDYWSAIALEIKLT